MTVYDITISIDTDRLSTWTDQHLAALWHVAQANPADIRDVDAGRCAEAVGREIIRRFLANTPPELYAHQGHHALFCERMDGRFAPTGQKTSIFPDSPAVSAASTIRSVSPAARESFSSEQAA